MVKRRQITAEHNFVTWTQHKYYPSESIATRIAEQNFVPPTFAAQILEMYAHEMYVSRIIQCVTWIQTQRVLVYYTTGCLSCVAKTKRISSTFFYFYQLLSFCKLTNHFCKILCFDLTIVFKKCIPKKSVCK